MSRGELFIYCLLSGVISSLLTSLAYHFGKISKPKCPNSYRCGDCVHAYGHWEGLRFKGFSCRKNCR